MRPWTRRKKATTGIAMSVEPAMMAGAEAADALWPGVLRAARGTG